jgi:folate-binding protein YgfZ
VASPSVFELIRTAAIQAPFDDWAVVEVVGSHRERFLSSQLSSDVVGLETGDSQPSTLLDRSGRVQAFCYLLKRDDRIELLVPREASSILRDQLEARIIADDVGLGQARTTSMRICLGPEALRVRDQIPSDELFPIEAFGARGFVTWSSAELEFPEPSADELEVLRVVSSTPKWGVDVRPDVLINETNLVSSAVSFTKGCFLGQETVAKVASHRGAAYQTVLFVVADGAADTQSLVGEVFAIGDRDRAGVVLGQVRWQGKSVFQLSMHRDFRVDRLELSCRFEDGFEIEGRVNLEPLLTLPAPSDQADELFHVAAEAFTNDREHEALKLLRRAIAVHPSHADSYESLGVILGRHGRYEEAIELMQQLLEVDPESVMAHTNMSLYYNRLGRIEDAEREAASAAEKQRLRERREWQRAEDQKLNREQRRADLKRREEMFLEVLELDPDDTLGNFGVGELCVEDGRFEDAVLHLEKAIANDPKYSAAYYALGRAWEGMRQPERAREIYATGVEVAAGRGDLATANKMQGRLLALDG